MKFVFLLIASVLSFFNAFGQIDVVVSEPIAVADGFDNLRPRIVLTQNNVPIVMWGDGANKTVYTARWNGVNFDAPVLVVDSDLNPYVSNWTGPDIAASGDDVWVVFDADIFGGFRVYTKKSSDGGLNYSDTVNVGGYGGESRFACIGADDGKPAVGFMNHSGGWTNPDYQVANSIDGGASYNLPVSASNVNTGVEVCDCCPAEVLVKGSEQVMLFRNNDNNLRDLWVGISNDGGNNFTIGVDIDDNDWVLNACPSTGADGIFRNDSLLVTWMSGGSNYNRIQLTAVNKANGMALPTVEVSPFSQSGYIQNYPRIDGDDVMYGIVYQEYKSGNGYNIMMAIGSGFNMNLDTTNVNLTGVISGNQYNPDIAYADGVFYIVCEDQTSNNVLFFTVDVSLSGLNSGFKSALKVFPNPIGDFVNIEIDGGGKHLNYEIFDKVGRLVKSGNSGNTNNFKVDCTHLESGNYMIRITADGNILAVSELVKQ